MFGWGKKEEKKENKNLEHPWKTEFLGKVRINAETIIKKLEEKRAKIFETGRIKEGKEDEVNAKFDKMIAYMKMIDHEKMIDMALANAEDPDTARYLLNLSWQSIKEDINSMINDVFTAFNPPEEKNETENN